MNNQSLPDDETLIERFNYLIDRRSNYISIMAKEFNVPSHKMQSRLYELGLSRKVLYDKTRPFNADLIRRYTELKQSHSVIGEAVGLNGETVRKRLIRMGIKSRDIGFMNYDYIKCPNRPDLTGIQLNQLIKETYEKCFSVKGVMKKLGLGDLETVRNRLQWMGYETNHRKGWSLKYKKIETQIIKFYKANHSIKYIAWKLNISNTTVSNWLERSGTRKKGESKKSVTLLELCEMNPGHLKVMQAKRMAYWYLKGFKMEDIASIESASPNKVSRLLRSLNMDTNRMKNKKYVYSGNQKQLLNWVLLNKDQYVQKINKIITSIDEKFQKSSNAKFKGRKRKFEIFLYNLINSASPNS